MTFHADFVAYIISSIILDNSIIRIYNGSVVKKTKRQKETASGEVFSFCLFFLRSDQIMKKYRVTVELITVMTVKCENREETKRLATAEASLLPNVVSRQILSVVRDNHKCDQSKPE